MQEDEMSLEDKVSRIDGEFQVELARQGRIITIPADSTIADVLIDAGINVAISCGQGICGTCLTKVLRGEPEHLDSFLTEDEQALNDQMALCCSRSRSPLLVLDI